jgi:NAD-dependent SIR2 family protein deacetylase
MPHSEEKEEERAISRAAAVLEEAEALVICAGAGMGVDSGLPDFRGDRGFWNAYPRYAKLGLRFIDLAHPDWFEKDPALAWGFYGHRLNLYRQTVPHEGFHILRQWGDSRPAGLFVFTSNVDGQFQKAGFDRQSIEECHGSIHHLQCSTPCNEKIWSAESLQIAIDPESMRAQPPFPCCPFCGRIARPNILMFGDSLWLSHRNEQQHLRLQKWLQHNAHRKVIVVECGAGTAIPTVRYTSERIVHMLGGWLIRINSREPQVPDPQIGLALGALLALQRIAIRLRQKP